MNHDGIWYLLRAHIYWPMICVDCFTYNNFVSMRTDLYLCEMMLKRLMSMAIDEARIKCHAKWKRNVNCVFHHLPLLLLLLSNFDICSAAMLMWTIRLTITFFWIHNIFRFHPPIFAHGDLNFGFFFSSRDWAIGSIGQFNGHRRSYCINQRRLPGFLFFCAIWSVHFWWNNVWSNSEMHGRKQIGNCEWYIIRFDLAGF